MGSTISALAIALAVSVAVGSCGWKNYLEERNAAAEFRGGIEAVGKQAAQRAAAQERSDKLLKEKTDAEYQNNLARLRGTVASLRREADSRGGRVPAAPAGSSRPDLACFDRAELSAAFGELVGGLRRLADEGDASAIALDAAKVWAQERR